MCKSNDCDRDAAPLPTVLTQLSKPVPSWQASPTNMSACPNNAWLSEETKPRGGNSGAIRSVSQPNTTTSTNNRSGVAMNNAYAARKLRTGLNASKVMDRITINLNDCRGRAGWSVKGTSDVPRGTERRSVALARWNALVKRQYISSTLLILPYSSAPDCGATRSDACSRKEIFDRQYDRESPRVTRTQSDRP